jgi:GMP synthase-like glutamine amidotransferase
MILVIQNDPQVPSGLLDSALHASGIPCEIIRLFEGNRVSAVKEATAVVVLGGSMSFHETTAFPFLNHVRECIQEALTREIPFLGICLGGQLLANVLGAKVHLRANGEQGIHAVSLTDAGKRDRIFQGMPRRFTSFQWHYDSFDLPPEAVHLAFSEGCPHQAFRYGKVAYGLQFHPEVDRGIVFEWSRQAGERQGPVMSAFFEAETDYRSSSMTLLNNFIGLAAHLRELA